jgi:predicted Zn-dependent protease
MVAVFLLPAPAQAYTTTGCKWSTGTLRIDIRYVNGNFRTGINQAISNYNSSTDVTLSGVDSSGPAWTAEHAGYGATGWEGHSSWQCLLGKTLNSQMQLNTYYLGGTTPAARLKIVWAHEMGHSLGLSHVSTLQRVMYTSASDAYNAGVRSLTSDEINGINSLY